jgi:transposase
MWPGNTADVTTLVPVIDRLRRRFDIARVCVVADRGMISAEIMAELEARRLRLMLCIRQASLSRASTGARRPIVSTRNS